jgi:hypothetical protein
LSAVYRRDWQVSAICARSRGHYRSGKAPNGRA